MKINYPFDPLLKHHLLIGLILAVWVFVFLFFTKPLDINELNYTEQLIFLPGYAFLAGLCYILFLPIQYFLYQRNSKNWNIISEILFLLSFTILAILLARGFYLYIVVANEPNPYTFGYMFKTILLPAVVTILPIIIIARFAFGKYHEKKLDDKKIEIKGNGNYEGLKLHFNNIICIQSSDNYIEVLYLVDNNLKKTLIRNKLSVIDSEFDELTRTHRLYLINAFHFQQWKTESGKHFLILNYNIKVPVSKTYLLLVKDVLNLTTN